MKKMVIIILVIMLGFLVNGCTTYRNIYDSKSGMYLETEENRQNEQYMKDANACVQQCLLFNATIIGFVINELSLEHITPVIYRDCMKKKGYTPSGGVRF